MNISIIVAVSENGSIGKNNQLLWQLSSDLRRFKQLTSNHHILMGRKTFDSIGKVLPNRTSLIISKNKNLAIENCFVFENIKEALHFAQKRNETEVFIIGGGEIYKQTLPMANTIYLTEVKTIIDGDTFFEYNKKDWDLESSLFLERDEKNQFDTVYKVLKRKQ